ncbi:MAG: cytochrome c biogenesis protein ResB, partial [Thermodesulfobacteriota bacterium]
MSPARFFGCSSKWWRMPEKKIEKSPFAAFVDFFASVKLSIFLLLVLAAASLLGTLIAQGEDQAFYVSQYGVTWARYLEMLGINDLYHGLWFRLLLGALTLNILVCSLKRLPSTWKIVRLKTPGFNPGRFESLGKNADFKVEAALSGDPGELRQKVQKALGRRFRRVRMEDQDKGFGFYAESGRWTRLGPYVIHLGFVLVLLGGLVGSMRGFSGTMNLGEGETSNQVELKDEAGTTSLPFALRCDSFSVTYYDSGEPKEYLSRLTVIENGKDAFSQDLLVNHPLRYRGINVFQASYGVRDIAEAALMFTERGSSLGVPVKAKVGERLPFPIGQGEFRIESFESHFAMRGMDLGPVFVLSLFLPGKEPEKILLPMDYPGYDKMRRGDFVITVSDATPLYYTGLSVTKDPGVPVVYTGFLLLIAGCFVNFFL